MRRVFGMRKYIFGAEKDHPSVAEALHLQDIIESKRCNAEEAVEATQRGVQMFQRMYSFDDKHPHLLEAESDLAKFRLRLSQVKRMAVT